MQMQLFVLMNRLCFHKSEIEHAQQELKQLLEMGVDGIVSQTWLYQVAKGVIVGR